MPPLTPKKNDLQSKVDLLKNQLTAKSTQPLRSAAPPLFPLRSTPPVPTVTQPLRSTPPPAQPLMSVPPALEKRQSIPPAPKPTALQNANNNLKKAFAYGIPSVFNNEPAPSTWQDAVKKDYERFLDTIPQADKMLQKDESGNLVLDENNKPILNKEEVKKTINFAGSFGPSDPAGKGKKFFTKNEISNLGVELENAKGALDSHMAKPLSKYANKNGEIPEVLGGVGGKFKTNGDDIVTQLGFSDSETARRSYQDYLKGKKRVAELEQNYKAARQAVRDEALSKVTVKDNKIREQILPQNKPLVTRPKMSTAEFDRKTASVYTDQRIAARNPRFESTEEAVGISTKKIADEQTKKSIYEQKVSLEQNGLPERESLLGKLKRNLNPVKYQDAKTRDAYKEWTRKQLVGKELANKEIGKIEVPNEVGLKTIIDYQKGVPTPYTEQIQKHFDQFLDEANQRGLKINRRTNYIPQVYNESPAEVMNAVAAFLRDKGFDDITVQQYLRNAARLPDNVTKTLKIDPSFNKSRAFPDYETAMEYGVTPKFTNPAQLYAYYRDELEKTLANKDFLQKLIDDAKILPQDQAPKHWRAIDTPFSPKGYYAEPKTADLINGIFRDEDSLGFAETITKGIAWTSRKAQELALSAGVPKSNINFFSIGQTIKQLTSGDFKAIVPFVRANFNKASLNYFKENQSYLKMMAEEGIDLGSRIGNYTEIYKNIAAKPVWTKMFGRAFDKMFNEKTFGSFMPQLYTQTFKGVYDKSIGKGMDSAAASKLAADITRNMFGMIEDMGRGKGTQDAISSLFFAPKFRESIINTLLNTAKSVTTQIKNPAFRRNRSLFAGMVITYGLYNAMNKKINGGYMWENEPGKEFALKIPYGDGQVTYVEFMPSFLSFARNMASGGIATVKGDFDTAKQKFGSVFSMPIKVTTELWANKDYFGNPIYREDDPTYLKTAKLAKHAGVSVNHPYIKELINYLTDKKPLYQTLIAAMELPMKFSTEDKINRSKYYQALDERQDTNKTESNRIRPIYDKVQELKETGNEDEARTIVEGLSEEDYAVYKKIRTAEKSKATREGKSKIYSTYLKVQELKKADRVDEARAIVEGLSEEDYRLYKLVKEGFE